MIESLDQANQIIRSKCNLTYASIDLSHKSFRLNSDRVFNPLEEKVLYKLFCDTFTFGSEILSKKKSNFTFGWEFKVFIGDREVIKVPNTIFYEVDTLHYIDNVKKNYDKLHLFIPRKYIAKTSFNFDQSKVYQEKGLEMSKIYIKEKYQVRQLYEIVNYFEELLRYEKWLPDVNIQVNETDNSILLSNVIMISNSLKINDFSYLYDPFRIHPEFTTLIVDDRKKHLEKVKKYLEQSLF